MRPRHTEKTNYERCCSCCSVLDKENKELKKNIEILENINSLKDNFIKNSNSEYVCDLDIEDSNSVKTLNPIFKNIIDNLNK